MDLKEYLKKEGWTIVEAAKQLSVTKQYLWMIVHGKRYPGITLAREIESFCKGEIKAYDLLDPTPPRSRCPTCGHFLPKTSSKRGHNKEIKI